jgi:SAM-dependent methyltransferase
MTEKETAGIEKYYAARAGEYDRVYVKPERQSDLRQLELLVEQELEGQDVLEIACGTGYWTQFLARTAAKILATDYNPETIQIARTRSYGKCVPEFAQADAYSLADLRNDFSAGFCGFWWSHIPRDRRQEFLEVFHGRLFSGARVMMIDNRYVEGSSTPIFRRDKEGNTYQKRTLDDGSVHEVLKNFPAQEEIEKDLSGYTLNINITLLDYFWMVRYNTL